MNQQERPRTENRPVEAAGPSGNPNGASLDAIRQQASGMIQFSEGMIASVLSGDSQAFNQAVKQPPAQ